MPNYGWAIHAFCVFDVGDLQVPSAFFLCDTFLMLDDMLGNKLFRKGDGNPPRNVQAASEGLKAKKCLGSLRYLWRNSRDAAHHPHVAAMKTLLQDSPLQRARRSCDDGEDDDDDEDESQGGSDHEHPDGAAAIADGSDVSDCPARGAEEGPNDDVVVESQPGSDSGCHSEAEAETPEKDDSMVDGEDDASGESSQVEDSSHSTLSAPTLRLGQVPKPRDSQRQGAWMGDFFATYGKDGCSRGLPVHTIKDVPPSNSWINGILSALREADGLDQFLD